MARAIATADIVSTVSERYAEEILTPEFGERLEGLLRERRADLWGITNGIDTKTQGVDFAATLHTPIGATRNLDWRASVNYGKTTITHVDPLPAGNDVRIVSSRRSLS